MRNILVYPDRRLREKSRPVKIEELRELRSLIDDMAETMYTNNGLGLAAPQIGIHKRVFIIDVAKKEEKSKLMVFINPIIVEREGEIKGEEGCLSFPGIFEEISRAKKVKVKALNLKGEEFELEAEGLLAVAIQHETDHLDGILLIDYLNLFKRKLVERRIKEWHKREKQSLITGEKVK